MMRRMFQRYRCVPCQAISLENRWVAKDLAQEMKRVMAFNHSSDLVSYVAQFEEYFAKLYQVPYAVAVSSGTDALVFALKLLGVGSGDEVITTPHSYIATALAILEVGATPVFVDITEDYTIDPFLIEKAITVKTKAILPVHIYGIPADMHKIMFIAKEHGLLVIEDACQAHGAMYHGRYAGAIGDIGCLSFHPTKTVGGMGDGGMMLINNDVHAALVKEWREPSGKNESILLSKRNPARLDAIQVPFLVSKMRKLSEIIEIRLKYAALYEQAFLRYSQIYCKQQKANEVCAYRDFVVRVPSRDHFRRFMHDHGVETQISYEVPLHRRPELKRIVEPSKRYPVCEKIYQEIVSLPLSHALSLRHILKVIDVVKSYARKHWTST